MNQENKYGLCDICQAPIKFPGLEAYKCSSGICGEEIIIRDNKKNKYKILSRHPATGWVNREYVKKIKERLDKKSRTHESK